MSAGGGALAADRDQLLSCAVDFVSYDTCEKTRGTVQELVSVAKHSEGGSDQAAVDQLRSMFGSRLAFGTAGLRGKMGPGTAAMNNVTVMQASQGLCAYLKSIYSDEDCRSRGVAIGFE